MKQTFSLDLTETGIRLTQREGKETNIVGEVALDDPQFETRVEDLRRDAEALASGGLETQLVIPNSEILYTSVDIPEGNEAPQKEIVRAGLDGLTPYDLDDLVFDWKPRGKSALLVAAVAAETLAEAESFAVANGFNPQSFSASPRKGAFKGAPNFGKTKHARDGKKAPKTTEDVTRIADLPDDDAVVATPDIAPAPVESVKAGRAPEVSVSPTGPDTAPTPAAERDSPDTAPIPETPAQAAKVAEAPAPEKAEKPVAAKTPAPLLAETKTPDPVPAMADDMLPPPVPNPRPEGATFASRRAAGPALAASEGAEMSGETALGQIASRVAMLPDGGVDPAATPAQPRPDQVRAGGAARRLNGAGTPGPKGPSAGPGPKPKTTIVRKTAGLPDAGAAAATLAPISSTKVVKEPARTDAAVLRAKSEADALTVFGARQSQLRQGGGGITPILIGLVVAIALAVGIWAALSFLEGEPVTSSAPEAGQAGLETTLPAETQDAASETAPVADTETAALPQTDPLPETDIAGGVADKTPVQADPVLPQTAEVSPTDPAPLDTTPQEDIAATDLTEEAPTDTAIAAPVETSPVDAPPAVPQTLADAETPDPLQRSATADASGRYAATGIWDAAPDMPQQPESDRIDTLYTAALDTNLRQPGVQQAPQPATPDRIVPQATLPPAPAGTTFDLDENGLVRATPDGAISPDGILVTRGIPDRRPPPVPQRPTALPTDTEAVPNVRVNTGTPDIRPRQRPTDEAVETLEDTAGTDQTQVVPAITVQTATLATLRPTLRPALVTTAPVTAEVTQRVQVQIADASTLTPRLRPQSQNASAVDLGSLQAQQTAAAAAAAAANLQRTAALLTAPATPAPPAQNLASASPFAVASSVQPRAKPSNVPQLLRREPAPQAVPQPQAVSATAAVAPRIPSRASVTKRATQPNVLKLRKINLVGVYGSSADRRALIRLPSGRFKKVKVGDRIDGGQVRAIGDGQLQYVKSGRAITLEMPRG